MPVSRFDERNIGLLAATRCAETPINKVANDGIDSFIVVLLFLRNFLLWVECRCCLTGPRILLILQGWKRLRFGRGLDARDSNQSASTNLSSNYEICEQESLSLTFCVLNTSQSRVIGTRPSFARSKNQLAPFLFIVWRLQ